MPQDYLRDLDDPEKANAFIRDASTPNTSEISRAHAASTLYLAYKTKLAGETLASSVTTLTTALQHALNNHAEALRDAAQSSEKYARGLNYATWALVFVTLVLAAVQVVTIYKGCP